MSIGGAAAANTMSVEHRRLVLVEQVLQENTALAARIATRAQYATGNTAPVNVAAAAPSGGFLCPITNEVMEVPVSWPWTVTRTSVKRSRRGYLRRRNTSS
jgi:hypothetical protein